MHARTADTYADTPTGPGGADGGDPGLLDMGLCMLCGRSISHYSEPRRHLHVNRCFDEYERTYKVTPAPPGVCTVCVVETLRPAV